MIIFTAYSKHNFFCRSTISEYVFRKGHIPINPFLLFDYFLNDRVPRDHIRDANNQLIKRADELWIFGTDIANGVLDEINLAILNKKPLRFFTISSFVFSINELQNNRLNSLLMPEPELKKKITDQFFIDNVNQIMEYQNV